MTSILQWYQSLPEIIDPVAFFVGSFPLTWYAISYIVALTIIISLIYWRAWNGESPLSFSVVTDGLLWGMIGALIGARLGYGILYDTAQFFQNPFSWIFSIGLSGEWQGIRGMSYFGGLIGAGSFLFGWARWHKIPFFVISDIVVVAVPAGYAFGRIGNFFNGELVGRITSVPWGVHYPFDMPGLFRHPSPLYEAVLEGVLLFLLLWVIRDRNIGSGILTSCYLLGYGVARFLAEWFRDPDVVAWSGIPLGQLLSIVLVIVAGTGLWSIYRRGLNDKSVI